MIFSAKTADALTAQLQQYRYVIQHNTSSLAQLAYNLQTTREAFSHRAAIVSGDREHICFVLAKDILSNGGRFGNSLYLPIVIIP